MNLLMQPATTIEYRCRAVLLVASQPVLGWLMTQYGGIAGSWYAPSVTFHWAVAASVLAVFGVWVRIQAASYLSSTKVARPDAMTDELIQTGPFGCVRNPLYVGSLVLFTGFALALGWIAAVPYFLFHLLRYQRVIVREEHLLRAEWGPKFEDYCSHVPRWLPRRPLALLTGSRWTAEAILGNAPFIGLAIGIVASIGTGNLQAVIICETLGFLVAGVFFLSRSAESGPETNPPKAQSEPADLGVPSRPQQ